MPATLLISNTSHYTNYYSESLSTESFYSYFYQLYSEMMSYFESEKILLTEATSQYKFYIKYGMILLFILFALIKIWKETAQDVVEDVKKKERWNRPSINLEEMDHQWKVENELISKTGKENVTNNEHNEPHAKKQRQTIVRDMGIFKNGQLIRHKYRGDTWIGVFNEQDLTIRLDNEQNFFSASGFAKRHIEYVVARDHIGRKTTESNGWTSCQVLIAGNWISLDEYSRLLNQTIV